MDELDLKVAEIDDAVLIHFIDSEYQHENYSFNMIKNTLKDKNCINIITYQNNVAIGYISYNCVLDEAELLKIVVLKNFRSRGFGKKIMLKSIEILKNKNIKTIILEVRKNNDIALKLYEKVGFIKIHERQKYYRDGEDAYIYKLSLT
jgi:ribosomal-protein-alanine N-acetyltransferase